MLRSRAVCVSVMVSPPPSKPIVCVPGIAPARVDETSIGARVTRAAHGLHQAQRGTRRRVPLRRVVQLVHPRAELAERCDISSAARATMAPNRFTPSAKFGAATTAMPRASASLADGRFVRAPTGRADDDRMSAPGRAGKLAATASPVEKSIATSASGQSALRPAFSRSTQPATSNPYSPLRDSTAGPSVRVRAAARGGGRRGIGHRAVPRRLAASNAASCSRASPPQRRDRSARR